MSRASGLSRIRILWPDRSVAAYINPCKLSTHSKLALKVAEVFGKDDIILDENGCSEDLKRKIDEASQLRHRLHPPRESKHSAARACSLMQVVGVPGGLDKLKGPDGDAFKAQIVYAATLARTKATCAKSGAFKEFVSATLNKLYSDASEALAGAKDFVTCDDIKVPVARLAALQQRTEEQLRRLDGGVAALEDGAKKIKERRDLALTASARSTKHTADAAAAIKEALDSTKSQLEDSIKRGAEQKALLAELKKQQADYEAREVARAHEQTVADAERDMMLAKLAEHEQLLVDHSSALADITSMKTHDTLQALKVRLCLLPYARRAPSAGRLGGRVSGRVVHEHGRVLGHGSPTDAAHVLEGFDRDSALDKYSVPATPSQRQRLAKIMADAGRVGGREMCDFGDAADSPAVAFPVSFVPEIEVWGAAEESEAPGGGAEWAQPPSGPDSYYTLPIPPMPYARRADDDTEPLRKPLMADCRTAAVTNLLRSMPRSPPKTPQGDRSSSQASSGHSALQMVKPIIINAGEEEAALRKHGREGLLLRSRLVFSACGNTLGRPGGAAAGASMARDCVSDGPSLCSPPSASETGSVAGGHRLLFAFFYSL
ncbi:hypothetical protein EMIHUDRAFT_228381 [Emiliania huxleyi CCMP1516]|uniref:Uncharacterized protein n=2 Tax=Emiliania huxleyi TaxID=2903 RepID=A0A0D3KFV1_EMIH1|nr:hypothetical protein EMIHUDRAFT_228381 [Emiliania huxleyi CCMP1516]EOD34636.1 hypothetical protein EMIHUDRAFT_228381 [Emiliania huxleyi CCMP1516]|eukprot:XP_005787065.1 hypothetical protein EMIHUDRAFT_228381 [Emiliania huxleyi CCMP1516]